MNQTPNRNTISITVISYYLCNLHVQGLFLPALLSFSTPTMLVLVAMSIWLTVLAAYWAMNTKYFEEVIEMTQ